MRFVDYSAFGLRGVKLTLAAPGKPDFIIFPMLHVADKAFYDQVQAEADALDLVLFEGVKGRRLFAVNWMFRLIADRKINLTQQRTVMRTDKQNWRHADIPADAFDEQIGIVPWFRRFIYSGAILVVAILIRAGADRMICSSSDVI